MHPVGEQPGLGALLTELSVAFGVHGTGVGSVPDARQLIRVPNKEGDELPPVTGSWPWQDDPSLVIRCQQTPGAITLERPTGAWLLTAVQRPAGLGWMLWLEDLTRTSFTDAEAAALTLAGLALTRWLTVEAQPRWAA